MRTISYGPRISRMAVFLAASAFVASAFGHHSATEYDRSRVIELEGLARSVSWRNPHVLIELETRDSAGREVVWNLEGVAVSMLSRRGVTEGLLNEGDAVRVAGYASTRRPAHMLTEHVLLPSGTELLVGSAREARWSEMEYGSARDVVAGSMVERGAGRGIFRVWTRAAGYWPWFFQEPHELELTASAAAAVADYDPFTDSPFLDCTQPGMPAVMGNPYPMEFIDHGETIEVRFEEFDVVRTIHMAEPSDPARVEPSPLGHSVGRWDGDTLIVTTTHIDWPYFGRMGLPQTQAVEVTERFALVDAENRIDYRIEMADPGVFAGTVTWEAPYLWRAGEAVGVYDCAVEGN